MEKIAKSDTDGLKLILTETDDGEIQAILEEDLEIGLGQKGIDNLLRILRVFADVKIIEAKLIDEADGEGKRKRVIELRISEAREITRLDKEELRRIKLYINLFQTLRRRMAQVEEEKCFLPKDSLDDIEFYTHLGVGEEIEKIYKEQERLLELAYFLRELYGIIQAKTGITRAQIISDKKLPKISKARRIVMFILRHKFDFLSLSAIAAITGEIGEPKDHATVILALKKFNKKGLDLESYKTGTPPELYEDAARRFDPIIDSKKVNKRRKEKTKK